MANLRLWRHCSTGPTSHEEAFVARYDALLRFALHMTGHDRARAEDLVHDAYVQFMVARPALAAIQSVDAYLHTTVRHLHLAHVRRAARLPHTSLSLIDYDAMHVGLSLMEPQARVLAQDELRRICQYACLRKETSKSGSVLILRFFHGFYAGEIALIVGGSVGAVAGWLHLARNEARAWLHAPETLAFVRGGPPPEIEIGPLEQFLTNIRAAILSSCRGACPSRAALANPAKGLTAASMPCSTLAHIVSCARCLDEVCRLRGIPPLAGRHPDSAGPERRAPARPRSMSEPTLRLSSRDVFEHRPKELHIAVNGFALGSQEVGDSGSAQTVSVHLDEVIAFVEVVSEQGIRLLLMPLEPAPTGTAEQSARVELSEGRFIEVVVTFAAPWPVVHVAYRDPLGRQQDVAESDADPVIKPPVTRAARESGVARWFQSGWRMTIAHRVMATVVVLLVLALMTSPATIAAAAEYVAGALRRIAIDAIEWVRPSAPLPPRSRRTEDIPLPFTPAPAASAAVNRSPWPRPLSPSALAGLEVEVLQRLDSVGAFFGEPIRVARTRSGGLTVKGFVDRSSRKAELLRALGALASIPALHMEIRTAAETTRLAAGGRQSAAPSSPVVTVVEAPRDQSAGRDVVRKYFLRTSPDGDVDARVRAFARDVLDRSQRALLHSWALKRIADRFSGEALRALNPDAYAQWQALLADHARGARSELSAASAALGDVFCRATATERTKDEEPMPEALASRADRLVRIATALDETVRAVLAVTPSSADEASASAKTSLVVARLDERYWALVAQAHAVTAAIEHATSLHP